MWDIVAMTFWLVFVKKNNIFMSPVLLRKNPDLIKTTKEGSLSQSQLRNVIRPAILQPPQALTHPEDAVVSLVTKKEAHVQLSEDSSYSSAESSVSSKTAVRSSTTMNLSSSKTTQSQLFKDRTVQNSSNSDFVFGENMVERVLSPEKHPKSCEEADSYKGEITSVYIESFHVSPQTRTALLRNATLIESAAAGISKPVEKILLDKVEVITGEEAEQNVLQINCKLFLFNKLSLTWIERGRGSLRLNDTSRNKRGMLQSRLIMRNQGSLRLILNTRLWDQMVIQRANRTSLCFTATDQENHSVQVFLIQASSKDTGYLYAAIHHRLVALRSFAEQEPDANQVDTESEITFQPLNCDSDDEDDGKTTQVSSSGSAKNVNTWHEDVCSVGLSDLLLVVESGERPAKPFSFGRMTVTILALKGSNYAGLLERHRIHTKNVEHVVDSLRNEKIEVRLVKRREYNEETVRWADAVISAGDRKEYQYLKKPVTLKDFYFSSFNLRLLFQACLFGAK
ncbi:PREDICTED: ran-binding protein 3-like [Charadrius vociferus]|uniref:ran-binding protein 3-like n=1 Tax=Charadrius vociferus TaxID=50402 RepID=UPI0005213BA3|nr:PREDICTED: ran-binding protein 3-like [Charadrius vociferus]